MTTDPSSLMATATQSLGHCGNLFIVLLRRSHYNFQFIFINPELNSSGLPTQPHPLYPLPLLILWHVDAFSSAWCRRGISAWESSAECVMCLRGLVKTNIIKHPASFVSSLSPLSSGRSPGNNFLFSFGMFRSTVQPVVHT